MCGITGAVWTDPRLAISRETLARMTEVLAHRGPDDSGTFASDLHFEPPYPAVPGVALGHRRLSIIDLAGEPPADGQRRRQRPARLQRRNLQLPRAAAAARRPAAISSAARATPKCSCISTRTKASTSSGTWSACSRWRFGTAAIAASCWPAIAWGRSRSSIAAEPGRLLFASELKSLLAVPDVPREIDPAALDEYLLYQYVPHPQTIFRGIHKLPPGHVAVFENDQLDGQRPTGSRISPTKSSCREAEYVERLRSQLGEAVRSQLVSDVPLGAFLSGGVDSSIIVALMREHVAGPIKTFTVGFPDPAYDESAFARRVADAPGHRASRVPRRAAIASRCCRS